MSYVGAQTDTYALSLSYITPGGKGMLGRAVILGMPITRWVNAVNANKGGAAKFVSGPWTASYGLGAYGVDQATHTAWAVVNHTGSFAVQHAHRAETALTQRGSLVRHPHKPRRRRAAPLSRGRPAVLLVNG